MQAMIFAAGLGTRLRAYNNLVPKPLIEINGLPILERVVTNLVDAGADKIVINTHYLAHQIEDFVKEKKFNAEIKLSYEPELLETGGGLAHVRLEFDDNKPILVHNSDVYTDINLNSFYQSHNLQDIATLAVTHRPHDPRPLLVSQKNYITGYRSKNKKTERIYLRESPENLRESTFCGLYVLSQNFLNFLCRQETNGVSIMKLIMSAIKQGHRFHAHDIGQSLWYDVGTPENIGELTKLLKSNV